MKPFKSFLDFTQSNPIINQSSRMIGGAGSKPRYKGSVLPSVMTFGLQTVNSQSAMQTAVVTNIGSFALPIRGITSVGDWVVTNNCPAVLQPGASCQISAVFNPQRSGMITGGIYVDTGDSAGTEFVQLMGVGQGSTVIPTTYPTLSISDGVISGISLTGSSIITMYPSGTTAQTTYAFSNSVVLGEEAIVSFRLLATGSVSYTVLPSVAGPFFITYGETGSPVTAPTTLSDGESLKVNVRYAPSAIGYNNNVLSITSSAGTNSITLTGTAIAPTVAPTGQEITVYFPNWGLIPDGLNYQVADIPIDNVTTVNYAFFGVGATGTVSYPTITGMPDPTGLALTAIADFTALKASGKVFNLNMSLGGGSDSTDFASAASSANRSQFVASIISMLNAHPVFTGVDLDWEFPTTTQQENDLAALITLLRQELNAAGKSSIKISAALSGAHTYLMSNIGVIGNLVDKVYLMTYDYSDGAWSGNTVALHSCALYPSGIMQLCAHNAVTAYLEAGVPASKIHIGVAAYSRGFANTDGLNQTASGASPDGTVAYSALPVAGSTEYWDETAKATYSYDATRRVFNSYDSVKSVEAKCDYVILNGLGGIMMWEASTDAPYSSARSLIKAMHRKLALNEAPPLPRVTIQGNQFYSEGQTIRLKSVNWFGGETATKIPHGLWARTWKPMVAQMASMGFNCIRLPFSREGFASLNSMPTDMGALGVGQGAGGSDLNPDLMNKTVYEIFDLIIEECRLNGMYVVLDHHRNNMYSQDGTPTNATYDQPGWLALWGQMATRYGNNTTVIGADLYNEPSNVPWAELAPLFEACGNHIHTIAPNWLIFCEGGQATGENIFWAGGNLEGVATRPVTLTVPNRVVYAPHEYAHSVYLANWLSHGSNVPVNWPNNLYAKRTFHWGFIFEQNIAPVWVGEFGGQFGYGDDGLEYPEDHLVTERQWLTTMITYMNGDFDGNGSSSLTGDQKGISFAFWCYNVNSTDTGGLLQTDWVTPQSGKLALLAPLLNA